MTCAIRHAGPLPRRLRCTSRLRLSVCLAGACLRFSFFSPRAPLCLFLYPRASSPSAAELRARVRVCRAQCARPVCAQKGVPARRAPHSAQNGAAVEEDAAEAAAADGASMTPTAAPAASGSTTAEPVSHCVKQCGHARTTLRAAPLKLCGKQK